MSHRAGWSLVASFLIVLTAGLALRSAWLTADPPTHAPLGIVWHDEGAWVHNARNRALWGTWRTDAWNPVFVAPVFTALEYAAFSIFGVGTWQARTVPVASGMLAVMAIAAGLFALAGRRAALVGGALLATNYVFVMWNRAALMESTMTAFIAAAWAAYAIGERRPAIGFAAGVFVVLAWFTKAAAAFFVAALVLDACLTLALARSPALRRALSVDAPAPAVVRAALWTFGGLAVAGGLIVALFVLPNWSEYRFYNWQMSVTRKPDYSVRSLMDRASWLPIVHDLFTRMWLVTAAAALGLTSVVVRWRNVRPAERLLVLWVLLGIAELVVHDAGNERRYVMFIPALVALTALVLGSRGAVAPPLAQLTPGSRWIATPVVLVLAYLVIGSLLRLALLGRIGPAVRLSAALAAVAAGLVAWRWNAIWTWLSRQRIPAGAAAVVAAIAVATDLAQYWQWTQARSAFNHRASVELASLLPEGTLVHGKLANGLSLENRLRPVFVGRGFGNYDDRTTRDDVRYVLTYVSPRIGYEGPVITDVLNAYPHRTVVKTFRVAETMGGNDRAALLDKFGGVPDALRGRLPGR